MTENTAVTDEKYVGVVLEALAQVLNRDVEGIGAEGRLFADLGLDSSSALELLIVIEEELGLQFDAEELDMSHFETVGSLAAFVAAEAGA